MTTSGAAGKVGAMLFNLPNMLTLSRIVAIPLVVACFWLDRGWAQWFSMALFVAAAVTDWFDGYFARRYHQISRFGRFLDPIADKLLVAAALVMLVDNSTLDGLNVLAALIILAREILVSGLREFLAELRVGLPVSALAKWKTAVQMVAIAALLVGDAAAALGDTGRHRADLDRRRAHPHHRLRLSAHRPAPHGRGCAEHGWPK